LQVFEVSLFGVRFDLIDLDCIFPCEVAKLLKEKLSDSDEVHRKIKERIVITPVDPSVVRMKISFAKVKKMFNWKPLSLEKTVIDTAESLIALGEVKIE
jgi:hypothetical protein